MKLRTIITILFSFIGVLAFSQNEKANSFPKGTIEGELENGLRYIVLENKLPAKKAEFRLVMRIGANQETDKQKGAAHFFEHMAFSDTKHFPNGGIQRYLESLGMKYGRDLNAMTGYDRTYFMFSAPLDKEFGAVEDSALLILKDWLCNVKFDTEKVERERGVILEELRGYDVGDPFYNLKIGNNVFSKRMPLGEASDISSMTKETLAGFYNTWYAPQIAAIIIVGDIDAKNIESKIKERFSDIPKKDISKFKVFPLEYPKGIVISELKDSLRKNSSLDVMIPCPAVVEKCCESTYQKYLYSTLTKALYTRLKNIDLNISLFNNWYLSSTNHFGFTISKETKKELLTQYSEIYRTFNQITKEGFLEAEIEEAKNDIIETLLRADYSETNTSSYIMENFTDHIISGDIYLCDDKEREVVVEKIKTISNNNLIPILEGFLENAKKTTLIAFNNGLKDETITSKEIKKAIKEGLKMPFLTVTHKEKAVEDEEIKVDIPELNILPQFDSTLISKIVDYKNLGIKEITLSNGIKLILRKTTDNTKNINLSILSKGGSFWLSKEEFPKYDDVAGYMELGGIEGIDEDTLSEFIMQKGMSSCLIFDNNWNGFMGSCNIESSLQLFNYTVKKLYNPQLCYESFEELIEEDIESFGKKSFLDKMIEQDPARQVRLRMDQLLGNISPSHGDFKSIDDIKKMDLDNVAKLYHSLYCNTTDKNILIAGNFDMDKIIKEAVSIFGSLPVQEMDSKHKLAEFSLPSESYSEQFDNSNETQTIIDYTFYGNYEPNLKNSLTLKIMRDILQNEVLDILRAQESIVYSPYVDLFYNGLPYGVYYVDFYLSVNTENGTKAINLIDNIIKKYQKEIISEEVLNNIKLSFQIAKRDALSDDNISAWSKQMETLIRNNESFADYNKYEEILKSITAEEIRESFNKYFNFEHILKLHQGELK